MKHFLSWTVKGDRPCGTKSLGHWEPVHRSLNQLQFGLLPAQAEIQDDYVLQVQFLHLGAWLFLGHFGHRYLIFFFPLFFFFLTPKRSSSQFTISANAFAFRVNFYPWNLRMCLFS